jgi:hypothetical protein
LLKKIAKEKSFVEAITSSITPIKYIKPPLIKYLKDAEPMHSTLMLSDSHVPRTVSLEETEGYAEYNFDIALCRIWKCVEDLIQTTYQLRKSYEIKKLYLDILGDMINDASRDENKFTNQFPNALACVKFAPIIAQAIITLVQHYDVVEITGVIGNESRISEGKMPAKISYQNYDYLLYHMVKVYLQEYIKAGKVVFNIPKSPEIVIVKMGYNFLLMHGYSIKNHGSLLPVYGVMRMEKEQQSMRKNQGGVDVIEVAHFHEENSLMNGRIYINSALTGLDEYAKNMLHKFGPATQTCLFVTKADCVKFTHTIKHLEQAKTHPFVVGDDDNDFTRNVDKFNKTVKSLL